MPISQTVSDGPGYAADSVYALVEEAVKATYIRALKVFPPDLKAASPAPARPRPARAASTSSTSCSRRSTSPSATTTSSVRTPARSIYWVEAGEDSPLNLARLTAAVQQAAPNGRRSSTRCARTRSIPLSRKNTGTNTGRLYPVMHYEFVPGRDVTVHCMPKGSGCENMSYLKMLVPADGREGHQALRAGLHRRVRPASRACRTSAASGSAAAPTSARQLAKRAMLRPVGGHNDDPLVAALEDELFAAGNELGLGPMGLGGLNTLFRCRSSTPTPTSRRIPWPSAWSAGTRATPA